MRGRDINRFSKLFITSGRFFATAGADRKIKIWEVSKGTSAELKSTLTGSNAAVMSLDFDTTGTIILGASNDFASRVWTVEDCRLRHTLTGRFAGLGFSVLTPLYFRSLRKGVVRQVPGRLHPSGER